MMQSGSRQGSRHGQRLVAYAALVACCLSGAPVRAQDAGNYPNQPVHVIVPFPAGGPADILARFVSERLANVWKQAVVIENRPGANTAIAAGQVAKMAPNGYNLFVVMDVTMVLNPLTNKSLSYDPIKDFAPITLLSKNTSLLTVHVDGPKSVAELIALGRANPGKLNFGAGIITTRLAAELFNRETGIVAQYVPFQGSPPTVQALMSKSVDYIVDGQASSLPLIQSGMFRALAKLNNGPVPALPQLRSLAVEAGAPALDDVSTWIGLVAPAGTPRAIVDLIQREVAKIYADPALIERLQKAGISPVAGTPEEFTSFMASETPRWGKVIKDSGIELN
jgi:tripartite-type tricarboxylate transporter receptor subunit TctC